MSETLQAVPLFSAEGMRRVAQRERKRRARNARRSRRKRGHADWRAK